MEPYYVYSNFLKEKYGEKVYRIPINLPLTCPNRDGKIGVGGCTFCGDVGAGFESRNNLESVEEQLQKNINYIGSKYHAKKFIAYFQNYTNTYVEQSKFEECILSSIREDVVEIAISTRPDCVTEEQLKFLKTVNDRYHIEINMELGLQTVNYHTLKNINRGHTLAEFIDCIIRCKKYGFQTTVHMILNLPQDSKEDVIEGAKILSALEVNGVKLHSLYIPKGSIMAQEYETGQFKLPESIEAGMIYGGCNCGNCHITISSNGDIMACRRVTDSKVANIFEDRLADVWICQMEKYRDY
ncbi:tRNA modification radical SAM protein MnmL/YtqA, partial [Filifactor alocis]